MATVFFDSEGLLLVDIMPHGTTINSDAYVATLKKLLARLSRVRQHQENQDVLLLHDNAQPYVSHKTTDQIRKLGYTTLKHPPYSPELGPCDYHLFGKLKDPFAEREIIILHKSSENSDCVCVSIFDVEDLCTFSKVIRKNQTSYYESGFGVPYIVIQTLESKPNGVLRCDVEYGGEGEDRYFDYQQRLSETVVTSLKQFIRGKPIRFGYNYGLFMEPSTFKEIRSNYSVSEDATPDIDTPPMLVVHFSYPEMIDLRPVVSIMDIDIAVALKCRLICAKNTAMKPTVFT
ncbi:hypothetical protein ANN_17591 [Periplaneta americana]|uniref:Mariner Mos1 transposase n=1 Tax=Periplaneta americana TaxID=6978 RepID=A0ABQ8SUU7_PERAM|nr:hypothetical protein ANN_17591 [Periplaneta americana]